jgi:DNA polymerase-1
MAHSIWLAGWRGRTRARDQRSGGENLRQHLDFLPLGKKLVTVVCDLDLPITIPELTPQTPDTAKSWTELFTRLEFKSWLKELRELSSLQKTARQQQRLMPPKADLLRAVPPAPTIFDAMTEPDRSGYLCILDAAELDAWLARLMPRRTRLARYRNHEPRSAAGAARRHLVCICEGDTIHAAYLPLGHNYAGAPEQLPLAETLEKLRPGWSRPTHGKARPAPQVRPAILRQPRRAAGGRRRGHACCNPTCWNPARRTTSARSPRGIAA